LGFFKGFSVGAILNILRILINLLRGRKRSKAAPSKRLESLSLALFFGFMSGGARATTALLRKFNLPERIVSTLTGLVAGLASAFWPSSDISLYLVSKAVEGTVTAAASHGWIKSFPYADATIFAVEMGVAFYGMSFEHFTMRRSFWGFLQNLSGKRLTHYAAFSKKAAVELGLPPVK
jgi:hypothetical protein